MTNDPREALQDIAAAQAEDMADFQAAIDSALEEEYDYEDDGQPSEYDEWQDYMGGDDWDQGQYDAVDDF
jgi:hypothetical protein